MSKETTSFEDVSLETLEKELADARRRVEFLEQKIYDTKKANKEIAWDKLIDAICDLSSLGNIVVQYD